MAAITGVAESRLRFNWLLDRRSDLIWYIGAVGASWFYVAIILLFSSRITHDPLTDPIGVLTLGGLQIPITLRMLVVLSWSYFIDAPHVFATLARTLPDPDEHAVRGKYLRRSWLWFVFGPLFILTPYLIGSALAPLGVHLSQFWLDLGWLIYFVFYRLWAYYHVVRQHWGFFSLYKRRNGDYEDKRENDIDKWTFNILLYAPLIMFMTSLYYSTTPGFPDLGLRAPVIGELSIGSVVYPLAIGVYVITVLGYCLWQVKRWQDGRFINGPKLLFLAAIVPVHLVAFSHPLLVIFLLPLITVAHNIQYLRIVWSYGRNKYLNEIRPGFRIARWLFASIPVYMFMGLLFTFALYQGPWIDFIRSTTGLQLDKTLFNGISMMAGVADPAKLQLGDKVFAALITGWAMQHYYIDSKIWRVRSDKLVQKNLNV